LIGRENIHNPSGGLSNDEFALTIFGEVFLRGSPTGVIDWRIGTDPIQRGIPRGRSSKSSSRSDDVESRLTRGVTANCCGSVLPDKGCMGDFPPASCLAGRLSGFFAAPEVAAVVPALTAAALCVTHNSRV
jgi:hypothetical protein